MQIYIDEGSDVMALQVWLPLNGDLRNQGLIDWTPTMQSGTTATYVDGKMGQALNTGGIVMPASVTKQILNSKEFSYACWLYTNNDEGATTNRPMIFGNNSPRRFSMFQYPSCNDLHFDCKALVNGTETTIRGGVLYGVLPSYQWVHIAFVYNNPNLTIYINGVKTGNISQFDYSPADFEYDTQLIHNSSYHYLNDIRLYDHALSPQEVKYLSQGLILHYPLKGVVKNIAKNSDKMYNWGFNSIGQSSNTLTNDNGAAKFTLVKNTSTGTAGNYWTYNRYTDSLSNFVEGETYTLSLSIKADVQRTIALGSLYESQTKVVTCEDNVVTSEWKKFWVTFTWTSTAKMTICVYFQNVEANSTINYWVKNLKLEKSNKPTPWCLNSSDSLYTSLGFNDTTIYDCSGYGNNGIINDTSIIATSDSIRYSSSLKNNQSDNSATYPIKGSLILNNIDAITISLWVKPTTIGTQTSGLFSTTVLTLPTDYQQTVANQYDAKIACCNTSGTVVYLQIGYPFTLNEWHHYTFVYDGTKAYFYKDGTLITSVNQTGKLKPITQIFVFYSKAGGVSRTFSGNMSDLRVYTTALSEDDIKDLYNVSGKIDNMGNLYAYELVEQ